MATQSDGGSETSTPSVSRPTARRLKTSVRRWLRAFHRDLGYLCVGLTVVYAVSGLAVNHIQDWEPNQKTVTGSESFSIQAGASPNDLAMRAAVQVLGEGATVDPESIYADAQSVEFESNTTRFFVDRNTQSLRWERDENRFFIRTANWLHLNRGKAAWTYIADSYALGLLILAISGMFMIPGRRGFWGRGVILVALGAAIPALYVHFSAT